MPPHPLDDLWPAVEAWYGRLPPGLFRLGVLLRHHLAAAWSEAGPFTQVLRRPADPPWLSLPAELLAHPAFRAAGRGALEGALLPAMAAAFAAAHIRERLATHDPDFDPDFARLEAALLAEAEAQLAQLFPAETPFWDGYRGLRERHARAGVTAAHWAAAAPPFTAQRRRAADWLALLPLPALALGEHPAASELRALLEALALHHHTLRECLAVRADLLAGRLSYPLARVRHAARLPADAAPEAVLGALVLTGVLGQIARENRAELEAARDAALALGLPGLAGHCAALGTRFAALQDLLALQPGRPASSPPALAFTPARASLAEAARMAESYVLADRTFRESWEVQRRGFLSEPEVAGRLFGPGLILETVCAHRADLAGEVSALLDRLAADGYRYYPQRVVPPDADDVGLALRLARHAAEPARHRAQLARPLGWLRANQAADGHLPCWLTRGVDDLDTRVGVALWGGGCATVEANVLLGLLVFDPAGQADLITRAGAAWLRRWQVTGLGGNAFYEPGYALWTALRLIAALRAWDGLRVEAERAQAPALEQLDRLAAAADAAQMAACLSLACLDEATAPEVRRLFRPEWIQLILARQRYDGGWPAEPLFVTPSRGEAPAWYASRIVTSAFCWAALEASRRLPAGP